MTTLVFVAPVAWPDVDRTLRELLEQLGSRGPTIFASPDEKAPSASGMVGRHVALNRPLELQREARWLPDVGTAVLVATHVSVEPVVISRRFPTAWLAPEVSPRPIERAVALADRAGLVAGRPALRRSLGLSGQKFLDIQRVDAAELRQRLETLEPFRPDLAMHAALSAEMFGRNGAALGLLDGISGSPAYRVTRIESRVRDPLSGDQILKRCLDSGDSKGVLAALTLNRDLSVPERIEDADDQEGAFLRLMLDLSRVSNLGELLDHPGVGKFASASRWTKRLILRQLLDHLESSERPSSPMSEAFWQMLTAPRTLRAIGPQHVALLADQQTPPGFLQRVSEEGTRYTAMAAYLELNKREFAAGRWVEPDLVTAPIEQIDSESLHPSLWKSAQSLWEQVTGRPWNLEMRELEPPPPEATPPYDGSTIGDLDQTARAALAAGDYAEGMRLFDTVRAACLSAKPPVTTTELAARLNIGWAMWKSDHPERSWAPYVASVLEAVRPHENLVKLRARHVDFLRAIESLPQGSKEERIVDHLKNRLADLTGPSPRTQTASALEALVEEIDATARHHSLWRSGLDYWRKMTGGDWDGELVDLCPPSQRRVRLPREAAEIAVLDKRAKRALARKRRWKAARLFARVRAASLLHDPPLTTTEQAARLNLGWTKWELGEPETVWRPYITSVLVEVGPSRSLALIRAQAAQHLGAVEKP